GNSYSSLTTSPPAKTMRRASTGIAPHATARRSSGGTSTCTTSATGISWRSGSTRLISNAGTSSGPRGDVVMTTYRAFEVTGIRQFALVTRKLGEAPPGQVRIRVESCGVCHSDVIAGEVLRDDPSQPVVPGHEIVGV